MDSVPQFHVDSLLFLGSHQLDIWVVFFLWRVCTGSLKFSERREAENKLGWLQERELEKTFFFFLHQCEFYNRRKLEKPRLCLLGGKHVISASRVGMKQGQGWDIKGQREHLILGMFHDWQGANTAAIPECSSCTWTAEMLPKDCWRGHWEAEVVVLRNWIISVLSEVVLDRTRAKLEAQVVLQFKNCIAWTFLGGAVVFVICRGLSWAVHCYIFLE